MQTNIEKIFQINMVAGSKKSDPNVAVRPSNSFSIRSLLSESRNETTPSARATNYDYIDYDSKGFSGNINH